LPINGNIQQTTARLNAAEIFLRQQIARPDASPFMAHVDLSDSLSENLKGAAKQFVGGSGDRIARFVELHLAAGVWLGISLNAFFAVASSK